MTDMVFADELPDDATDPAGGRALPPWTVLIVDDDPAVHQVTQLVMEDFEFAQRRLHFLNAYSGADARALLSDRDDIALVLLDVVMESEHAGLDVARFIREELRNQRVRIVLRTGQPGQAPEEDVIRSYDINDYKEKTELTKRKLITVFYSALRSYRDIQIIEQSRQALRRSLQAITQIHDSRSLPQFASALLEQIAHLLGEQVQGLCASRRSTDGGPSAAVTAYAASRRDDRLTVLAATSEYQRLLAASEVDALPAEVRAALEDALRRRQGHVDGERFIGYYRTHSGNESLLYMALSAPLDDEGRQLLELFCTNVAIAYEHLLKLEAAG